MCAVPTSREEILIFGLNSLLMAPMVYIIINTSSRFVMHRTIPRRWQLLVCSLAFYWTTLGKIIYSIIRPSTTSVINHMFPQNTGEPNKSTGSFMWTVHEKMRRTIDERIEKSGVGEHAGEASAPSGLQSQNLQAAADRLVRDCGRVVCKTVQSIGKTENIVKEQDHSPKSPSPSPHNPFN